MTIEDPRAAIERVLSDCEWHYDDELMAVLVMAGLERPYANGVLKYIATWLPDAEVWEGKRMDTRYRRTPPGQRHVPWRWNSGRAEQRQAREEARAAHRPAPRRARKDPFPTTRFLGPDGAEVIIEQLPAGQDAYDAKVAVTDDGQLVGWWSNRPFDPVTQEWGPEPRRQDKRWGWWASRVA